MSATDKAKNKAQEVKGKAKEAAGKAVGNERLEAEGKADQVAGNAKQAEVGYVVALDRATGAVLPTKVMIEWPAQKISMKMDLSDVQVNAIDRIGDGPWYGAKGNRIAMGLSDLHGDTLDQARVGNVLARGLAARVDVLVPGEQQRDVARFERRGGIRAPHEA